MRLLALGAACVFAAATAFYPRRRSAATVAALAAAIIVTVQMTLPYWTFAYAAWLITRATCTSGSFGMASTMTPRPRLACPRPE